MVLSNWTAGYWKSNIFLKVLIIAIFCKNILHNMHTVARFTVQVFLPSKLRNIKKGLNFKEKGEIQSVPIIVWIKWRLLYRLCSKRDYFVHIILYYHSKSTITSLGAFQNVVFNFFTFKIDGDFRNFAQIPVYSKSTNRLNV